MRSQYLRWVPCLIFVVGMTRNDTEKKQNHLKIEANKNSNLDENFQIHGQWSSSKMLSPSSIRKDGKISTSKILAIMTELSVALQHWVGGDLCSGTTKFSSVSWREYTNIVVIVQLSSNDSRSVISEITWQNKNFIC